MMKRKPPEYNKSGGTWLTTYADLMNNLLVLFILLYMMSTIDLQKFKNFTTTMSDALNGNKGATTSEVNASETNNPTTDNLTVVTDTEAVTETEALTAEETDTAQTDDTSEIAASPGIMDNLDEFVKQIIEIVNKNGYGDQMVVERVNNYVYLRFKEGVLFYPNLADLKPDSYEMLKVVADIVKDAYDEIYRIEICGHTAWVAIDDIDTNFNSWELSSDRSLTVLKFFVSECGIPKDKMVMSAFSSTEPYTEGTTEEDKAMNRRVEIRLSRIIDVEK
jgi:Flagellar motor protein